MKIEIKNVKHSEFASQETHCFEASVYLDGKKVADTGNDGHGGCDNTYFVNDAAQKAVNDYIASLPKHVCSFTDPNTGEPAILDESLDMIVGELVNEFLLKRDMKRDLSKRVLFTVANGEVHQSRTLKAAQRDALLANIPAAWEAVSILNLLPTNEALAIYKTI
tara:strand:+ start:2986 stop:3477 length:492 start_codon:yes stop_codon:yes gene_type:complete